MISIETWITYTLVCIPIILAPGPDNILVVSRGVSQGRYAALISCAGAGSGLIVHIIAAVLGLAVLIQTSVLAFSAIKLVGAGYLIWIGIKALRSKDLVSLSRQAHKPLRSIFITGFLTTALNPKPAIFVVAFVPQFVSPSQGSVELQIISLGVWFGILAFIIFGILGILASFIARWIKNSPRAVASLNVAAGASFIAAGLSVALLKRQ